MVNRLSIAVLVPVLVVSLAPFRALAQSDAPTPEHDARLHFELGQSAFARADYEAAAREFEAALALVDRPELHYNLFLVYHELDRDAEAATQLRAYLPNETDPSARTYLEARLARLERASHEGEPVEAETTATLVDLPPATEEPPVADPPPPVAPPERTIDPGAFVLLASGGALLIAGLATGAGALDDQASLDRVCGDTCPSTARAVQDRGRALALASDVLWISGAATAAAGLAWLLVSLATPAPATEVSALCLGDGCVVTARGSF